MRLGRALAALVAALGLAGCVLPEEPPAVSAGPTPAPPSRPMAYRVADASLFSPAAGPVRLQDWTRLRPPEAPVPAVIYVPGCSTKEAAQDHVPFLQSQGVAVVLPTLDDAGCAHPEAPFNVMHAEVQAIADRLAEVPWVDHERLYLMGHAVGADVATTFAAPDTFKGVIGLAAACPLGVQRGIPTLTFRALDDPVLANRTTRCREYESPNSLHLEFAGSDHVLRLQPNAGPSDARALVRRAIVAFVGGGAAATPTIADADASDLRQLGTAPAATPVAEPEQPATLADQGPALDAPEAEEPLVAGPVVEPAPAVPPPPAAEALYIPDLRLSVPSLQ